MINEEIWKPIKGYEGYYEVSNIGNVRSLDREIKINNKIWKLKGKLLKKRIESNGYLAVVLFVDSNRNSQKIHRLVADAFIDNANNKKEVNHINFIKDDNRVENLEWVTRSENMKHAGVNGKLGGVKGMFVGSKSVRSKIKEEDVIEMRRLKENGLSSTQIQKIFPNLNARHIRDILNRIYWKHI